jgi:hypothetical protein
MRIRSGVLMVLWCGFAAGGLGAQALTIQNPSFEANPAPAGGFPVQIPSGWTLFDPQGIVDQNRNAVGVLNPALTTFYSQAVPNGSNVALIYLEQRAGTAAAGDAVGLSQVLSASLQPQTLYTLTVDIGNIASGTGLGAFAGFGAADLSGFPGYRVELFAGNTFLASDNNSLGGLIPDGEFRRSTVTFQSGSLHAALGQALTIRLINLNLADTGTERGREVNFDNVAMLATPVPEPSAAAMLAGGLVGMVLLRRRIAR